VYSYLAQGAIFARGLDPYRLGPAMALGIDDPLVRSIPDLWRDTPAPYGPLFLMIRERSSRRFALRTTPRCRSC
jgi:alpha-1,6-mannosyltransferase